MDTMLLSLLLQILLGNVVAAFPGGDINLNLHFEWQRWCWSSDPSSAATSTTAACSCVVSDIAAHDGSVASLAAADPLGIHADLALRAVAASGATAALPLLLQIFGTTVGLSAAPNGVVTRTSVQLVAPLVESGRNIATLCASGATWGQLIALSASIDLVWKQLNGSSPTGPPLPHGNMGTPLRAACAVEGVQRRQLTIGSAELACVFDDDAAASASLAAPTLHALPIIAALLAAAALFAAAIAFVVATAACYLTRQRQQQRRLRGDGTAISLAALGGREGEEAAAAAAGAVDELRVGLASADALGTMKPPPPPLVPRRRR